MRLFAVVPALALLATGCAGGHKDPLPAASTCGIPYTFTARGHTVESGSCSSLLGPTTPELTVKLGERFSVSIEHEQSGRLDFPVPAATSDSVRLLSQGGSTAEYVARALGHATLLARHTRFCVKDDPRIGTCPALEVSIIRWPPSA